MTLFTPASPLGPAKVPLKAPPNPSAETSLGDPEHWVDRHGDALMRFAVARVGEATVAEDLVQETLLSGWRSRDSFRGECSPRTWLISIMKRRLADHFRRCGRSLPCCADTEQLERAALPTQAGEAPASETAEAAEFWSVIAACTGDLPEHLARAFRLRAFGEEAPDTICEAEGISRKNLSVRLCRARNLLRQCLEKRWFSDSSGTGSPA